MLNGEKQPSAGPVLRIGKGGLSMVAASNTLDPYDIWRPLHQALRISGKDLCHAAARLSNLGFPPGTVLVQLHSSIQRTQGKHEGGHDLQN